MNGCGGPPPHL
jgi:hypothetical protein